jgi:hypothetical protein
MNNRIKMTDSKFKCNIFLFLSVTVFMARLSIYVRGGQRVKNISNYEMGIRISLLFL